MNPTTQSLKESGFSEVQPGVWTKKFGEFTRAYIDPQAKKRIRQSSKPLLNDLETEYLKHLQSIFPLPVGYFKLHAQVITFRLANGLKYTPDIFAFNWPSAAESDGPTAFEVKGKWFPDDAKVKLKMFAHEYPSIRVILVWKENGQWQSQRVLA